LELLQEDAGLAYAAVICASGTIVASVGATPGGGGDEEVAALASGAAFSTRALAARLGQTSHDGILQEDPACPFYLLPLGLDYMLLAVGGLGSVAGLVRLACRRRRADLTALTEELRTGVAYSKPGISWGEYTGATDPTGSVTKISGPKPLPTVVREVAPVAEEVPELDTDSIWDRLAAVDHVAEPAPEAGQTPIAVPTADSFEAVFSRAMTISEDQLRMTGTDD